MATTAQNIPEITSEDLGSTETAITKRSEIEKERRVSSSGIRRSPNWSTSEIQILCDFVRENKAQLFGIGQVGGKKGINAIKKKHWEICAAMINTKAGKSRHWSQVRKKWKDLSYFARSCQKKEEKMHESGKADGKFGEGSIINSDDLFADDINSFPSNDSVANETEISNHSDESITMSSSAATSPFSTSDGSVKSERDITNTINNIEFCFQPDVPSSLNQRQSQADSPCIQPTETVRAKKVASPFQQRSCCCANSNDQIDNDRRCKGASQMTPYQESILQITKEQLVVQRKFLRCARDIVHWTRRIGSSLTKLKRRSGESLVQPPKRYRREELSRTRWRHESETSDPEYF
ncbi:unnamed protein product [Clavelina lepadiformis]|uniref:Myb/SANT-like DNA-binding domain-containing protein n=1 Tax=Clavelina lepadiformis TaxID=159417 RepID=A0ABP0F204_CLALP